MKRESGNAIAALLAVTALSALVLAFFVVRLTSRLSELEEQVHQPAPSRATPLALAEELHSLEERVRSQAEGLATLDARSAENTRRIGDAVRVAEGLAARPVSGAAGPTFPEGALEEAVARVVEKKIESLPRGDGQEWKPTLAQLQEVLGLAETQMEPVERIFNDAKHETFELLSLPRADGTSMVDELATALRDSEEPEAAVQKFFRRLFTEQIPGRSETYIVEVLRIKERTQTALDGILTPEQATSLSRRNLDHLGVVTSYDPFADFLRDSVR